MFEKILIANRGEIACRIASTARRMGVRTVAVYSDADAGARHVGLCDEAFHLGPPPARESYLRGDAIIRIMQACGAQVLLTGTEPPAALATLEIPLARFHVEHGAVCRLD